MELALYIMNVLLIFTNCSFKQNCRDVHKGLGEARFELVLLDGLFHKIEHLSEPFKLLVVALNSELIFLVEEVSPVRIRVVTQSDVHLVRLTENEKLKDAKLYCRDRNGSSLQVTVLVHH